MTFTPLGSEARWKTIYRALRVLQPGDVITYDELGDLLSLHPADERHAIQMSMHRALTELLHEDRRTCETVRGVGYRVVLPAEHLMLARRRNARARVQVKRGFDVATNVDLNAVDPHVRGALETVALHFMRLQQAIDATHRKAAEAARGLELLGQRHDDVEERLGRLERMISSRREGAGSDELE